MSNQLAFVKGWETVTVSLRPAGREVEGVMCIYEDYVGLLTPFEAYAFGQREAQRHLTAIGGE